MAADAALSLSGGDAEKFARLERLFAQPPPAATGAPNIATFQQELVLILSFVKLSMHPT
jgi:hypothetical protein